MSRKKICAVMAAVLSVTMAAAPSFAVYADTAEEDPGVVLIKEDETPEEARVEVETDVDEPEPAAEEQAPGEDNDKSIPEDASGASEVPMQEDGEEEEAAADADMPAEDEDVVGPVGNEDVPVQEEAEPVPDAADSSADEIDEKEEPAVMDTSNSEKAAVKKKNGLETTKKGVRFYNDGVIVKNALKTVAGKKYYFGSDGYAKTGWFNVGAKLFYAASTGVIKTGFARIGGKLYYLPGDGNTRTGWQTIGGRTYYFGAKGLVNTGFKTIDGRVYYFTDSRYEKYTSSAEGVVSSGSGTIDGTKYYFIDKNADTYSEKTKNSMAKGWITIGGRRYHFESSGAATKGWRTLSGKKYYFASTGRMHTGVTKISGRYYCLSEDGALLTGAGFKTVSGKKYYTDKNGVCLTGFKMIDGKGYCFETNGQLMKDGPKKVGDALYVADKNGVCKTGMFSYQGYLYMADPGTCRVDTDFVGDYTQLDRLSKDQKAAALQIIKVVYDKYKRENAGRVFTEWDKVKEGNVIYYKKNMITFRVKLKKHFTKKQLTDILYVVSDVYTGNFTVGPEFEYSQDSSNVLTLKDTSGVQGSSDLYRMSAIYSFAKLANRECLKEGMTDREKVAAIRDYLCRRFTYRHEYDARRSDAQHGIRYALESGYAGSEYATFFYAMCGDAGIECERLTGDVSKSAIKGLSSAKMQSINNARTSSVLPHAWNRVKINGKWLYVDCAADDDGTNGSGKYMLVSKLPGHSEGYYDCVFEWYYSSFQ